MSPQTEKENQHLSNRKKLIYILLSLLFVITIIFVLFLIFKGEDFAKNLLIKQLNEQLAPHAEIEIGDFIFSVRPASISIENIRIVHITPFEEIEPNRKTDSVRQLSIKKAAVEGISFFHLLIRRQWVLDEITINGLDVETVPFPEDDNEDKPVYTFPLSVSELLIENSNFTSYWDREALNTAYSVKNLSSEIFRFSFSESDAPIHTYFEEITLKADVLLHKTENGLYEFLVNSFDLDSRAETVYFEEVRMLPQKSARQMARDAGAQTDQYNFEASVFVVNGFKLNRWLIDNALEISAITIDSPKININRDKAFPRAERNTRLLPQQQFINLSYGVKIDTLRWNNGSLRYIEEYPENGRRGEISFYEFDLLVEQLQNQNDQDSVRVHASAQFLGQIPIQANYLFSIRENAGHSITGSMGGFDLTLLNPILENMAAKHIRKGMLEQFEFRFHAGEHASAGTLNMIYRDFELRFLDEVNLQETRRRRLRSFFANRLRIRAGNNGDNARLGTIEFERDEERSIFNYWWKSVLTGIDDIVVR